MAHRARCRRRCCSVTRTRPATEARRTAEVKDRAEVKAEAEAEAEAEPRWIDPDHPSDGVLRVSYIRKP